MSPLIVVMGVSGAGKTTVGMRLAERMGVPFAEADDFHRPENVAKMASGFPLDDDDRRPWLAAIAEWLAEHGSGGVVTSSALKRSYRDRLRKAAPLVSFLHLDGSRELIAERLVRREGHFMPSTLLDSQFEALEPLSSDERGAAVPIDGSPDEVVERALAALPSPS